MSNNSYIDEPIIEAFVYECTQIVETLEQVMITSEEEGEFSEESINEIFRFMHTIKGSSAMMMFNDMSSLAHRLEDIFYVIREKPDTVYDFTRLVDLILESVDYLKIELMKVKEGEEPDGDNSSLLESVSQYLESIKGDGGKEKKKKEASGKKQEEDTESKAKQKYYIRSKKEEKDFSCFRIRIWFEDGAGMENVRAYTVIHNLTDLVTEVVYFPKEIIEDEDSVNEIVENGFLMFLKTSIGETKIREYFDGTIFLLKLELEEIEEEEYLEFVEMFNDAKVSDEIQIPKTSKKYEEKMEQGEMEEEELDESEEIPSLLPSANDDPKRKKGKKETVSNGQQSMISVNVDKLDKLMDLVGEMVIAEAMVTQNPEVLEHEIDSFEKSSRQLHKITEELQDMVMAIRMVPLSTTFIKMHRIVRDMTKKLDKNVRLEIHGEETEVDKNIIEKIADPLMHIIRNSIDHGIETASERKSKGKSPQGTVLLEAKNSGSDVLIIIKDDGKGLDKKKIYEKAFNTGLVEQAFEDLSDRELYNMILQPGFSTKEKVTEFSGRGVGMDVVAKNIESVGGTVLVESVLGEGTTIILKIPLTLAIIEGMNIKVGNARFTIPIVAIRESFRPKRTEIFKDTEGYEMIMVRGLCYPVIRLHEFFDVQGAIHHVDEGILIMVEDEDKSCCIFADELLGQQQVVVKALPEYVKKYKKIQGLGGCTLLGDGSISLILDVGEFNLSNVNERMSS